MLLKDKNILITGGTSGLGLAIAQLFCAEGAIVTVWGRNPEKGASAKQLLQKAGPRGEDALFMAVDVADTGSIEGAAAELEQKRGALDVLVNCAGITRDGLMMKMSEADWDDVLTTNLKSAFTVTKAFMRPMMKKRSGRIINISSVIGLTGNPGQVNYSASKAGMIGMTRSLAKEVASRNITVNCIAPGFFETEMTDVLTEKVREDILRRVPMGRLGDPVEVAKAALFFASSLADFITGQTLAVDGGMVS